ncbi:MAG TPA: DUF192 domain-containing protein [Acidimicrobiia bacterium]|jgi:uncharacterized membrane protein (UPF0127 family)|nr:DUF192 domain-containing protein [Acidimicrobiia bacterium]
MRAGVALWVTACALVVLPPAAAAGRSIGTAVRAARPAQAPFIGLGATTVHVAGRPLDVVLARTEPEREAGLRERSTLGPYGGMLFVFAGDTSVGFTMSTVPVALDIGFYRSDGRAVGQLRMRPCPGPESACPEYRTRRSFRYALETLAGRFPRGRLTG